MQGVGVAPKPPPFIMGMLTIYKFILIASASYNIGNMIRKEQHPFPLEKFLISLSIVLVSSKHLSTNIYETGTRCVYKYRMTITNQS